MTRIAYNSMNSTLRLFLSQPLLHQCYTICIRPWAEWFYPLPLRYLIEKREWALGILSLFFSHFFSPTFSCGFPLSKNDYDWRPYLFLSMLRWFQQRSPVYFLFQASGVSGPMPSSPFFSSSPFFQPVHSSHFEYWYCYVFIFCWSVRYPRSSRQASGAS